MTQPTRPEPENDFDRRHFAMIDEHGWAVMSVFPTEDDPGEPFSYTTGIYAKFQAPEMIVIGLGSKISHRLCNEYGARVQAGDRFEEHQRYEGFLDGYVVEFRAVDMSRPDATKEYMNYSSWYYFRQPFPAMQLVWPGSGSGLFPWEPGSSQELRDAQPLLCADAQ